MLTRRRTITAAVARGIMAAGAGRPLLGVYGGNDPANITQFEQWVGCPVGQVLVFTGLDSWTDIADPSWFVRQFAPLRKPCLWSVPLVPKGATLKDTASGLHDDAFRSGARVLRNAVPHAGNVLRVRFGWELNGNWFPWSAIAHEREFVEAYRRAVDAFRQVDDRFRFEWNFNYGQSLDPQHAFPGSDHVDVIGMDLYWDPRFLGNAARHAFETIRDVPYGLTYLDGIAARWGKPIAFSEWGVQGDSAEPFINMFSAWMQTRDVLYHNYWNSDAAYVGLLSSDRWPATGAAFRSAFAYCR